MLLFVVLAFIMGVCEIILRYTHLFNAKVSWSEPDDVLGWRFSPEAEYWFNNENDHPITGRINSFGWRDIEWQIEKPQNTYRIAVLGDSYVEAFQVESNRTFLALTEEQLNKNQNTRIELMNFGRSGCTQAEELLILENHVEQFFPDMVILFFTPGNDIQDVSRETAPNILRPFYNSSKENKLVLDTGFTETREFKTKRSINWLKQRSVLISLLCERYNAYKQKKQIKSKKITRNRYVNIEGYLSLCTDNPDLAYVRNYELNKRLIEAIAGYCNEREIVFMLAVINTDAYMPEIEKRYRTINPTFNANFFENNLQKFAKAQNIKYLGLQRIFRQFFEDTNVSLHWGHWNYEGHRAVANALVGKLKSHIDHGQLTMSPSRADRKRTQKRL